MRCIMLYHAPSATIHIVQKVCELRRLIVEKQDRVSLEAWRVICQRSCEHVFEDCRVHRQDGAVNTEGDFVRDEDDVAIVQP